MYLPSVTGREVSTPPDGKCLVSSVRAGCPGSLGRQCAGGQLQGDSEELLRSSLPSFLGQDPPLGNRQLSGVTALVILGRVAGTELLPLQVERIEGEGGGGGRREGEEGDRCPDRWAWRPALPA